MIRNRSAVETTIDRKIVLDCLEAGIRAGEPGRVLEQAVCLEGNELVVDSTRYPLDEVDRVLVVGGGKAAGRQARAMEALLGERIDDGIVVTSDPVPTDTVTVRTGDHPVPTDRNVAGTREMCELVATADDRALVIVVVSGGGSALMSAPVEGVPLSDVQQLTTDMLESGATIDEINAVRKHLSTVKGGQLASLAAPAQVVAIVMSDVVGNDPAVIASGPTVPDRGSFEDAITVIDRYAIDPPTSVADRLAEGVDGCVPETPGPTDPVFSHSETHIVASGMTAATAAADCATDHGVDSIILSTRIRGEAREVGGIHVAIAEEVLASDNPIPTPGILITGGETTVTVDGSGRGGPNQELALAAAIEIDGPITLGAIDTDGIDGTGPAAGAVVDRTTAETPVSARAALDANDAYAFLSERDDAIETGPTGTNLNDLRVVLASDSD